MKTENNLYRLLILNNLKKLKIFSVNAHIRYIILQ